LAPGGRGASLRAAVEEDAPAMDSVFQQRAFIVLLVLVTIAFVWLLIPFYGAVFWAVILAIVFNPLQRRLVVRFRGRRTLAAIVNVVAVFLIAVVPVTFVVVSMIAQGAQVVEAIQSGQLVAPTTLNEVFEHLPAWAQRALTESGLGDFAQIRARLTEALVAATQFLAGQALNVGQNTLRFAASVGVMLYVLFFLFRDGPSIGRALRESIPLNADYTDQLTAKFAAVVRATVKGNIIIAVIQGGIGGLAFWALGIPGALLWGVLMMFLSMLPAVGAALVWAPVAGYLLLSGDSLRGGLLVAIGVGVIGLIDNLLRPPLVGKDTRLPDYVVLVSTLGGLSIFGINGFVIGPLVAALFFACWRLFRESRLAETGVAER
jgi:predicted PurR-regulated permease PerM